MAEVGRKPGRPRREGGPDPTRSFRSGAVYDDAQRIAKERGDTLAAILNDALATYVRAHSGRHSSR